MGNRDNAIDYAKKLEDLCMRNDAVSKELYQQYGVKRGLRDENGKGVLTGLTNISEITAFKNVDGKQVPCDGQLLYRGYDVKDLVKGSKNRRFIFEEGAYLLLSESCRQPDSSMNFARSLRIVWKCRRTLRETLS